MGFADRRLTSTISMSVNAWTALDIMAGEDDTSASRVLERLVNAEAGRRLAAKQPATEPKQKKKRVLSEEERTRRSDRLKAIWAKKIAEDNGQDHA